MLAHLVTIPHVLLVRRLRTLYIVLLQFSRPKVFVPGIFLYEKLSRYIKIFLFVILSISWEYNPQTKVISVDQYENSRPPRRVNFEMVLPRHIRQSMLRQDWNVSQSQIAAAVRQNIKVKNQRRATVNNIGKATKLEEVMENAGKRVFRSLRMQKSTTKQAEALSAQAELAARRRLESSKFQDDLDAMSDSHEEELNSSDSMDGQLVDDDDDIDD
jgi:hypothetical protein